MFVHDFMSDALPLEIGGRIDILIFTGKIAEGMGLIECRHNFQRALLGVSIQKRR